MPPETTRKMPEAVLVLACPKNESMVLHDSPYMKFALILLLSLPCVAKADSPTSPNGGVPQPTAELKVMTERLHLSQDQQDQIAPILVAEANQRTAIQNDSSLSVQEKHDQTGVVHRAALRQIKALFTPEQLAIIEQAQAHPQPGPTHPSTTL
jgi:hypothetical protein